MIELLRDLRAPSSSALGILSPLGHDGSGIDDAIAARCLELLSIAYPAEFSIKPSGERGSSAGDAAAALAPSALPACSAPLILFFELVVVRYEQC